MIINSELENVTKLLAQKRRGDRAEWREPVKGASEWAKLTGLVNRQGSFSKRMPIWHSVATRICGRDFAKCTYRTHFTGWGRQSFHFLRLSGMPPLTSLVTCLWLACDLLVSLWMAGEQFFILWNCFKTAHIYEKSLTMDSWLATYRRWMAREPDRKTNRSTCYRTGLLRVPMCSISFGIC